MAGFTKGQWDVKASKNKLFLEAIGRDKYCFEAVMQNHYTLYGPSTEETEFVVDITTDANDEGLANVNLIAAAPDIYEELSSSNAMLLAIICACKEIDESIADDVHKRIQFNNAALKRARGEFSTVKKLP